MGKFLFLTSIIFGFGGLGFGFAIRHGKSFLLNSYLIESQQSYSPSNDFSFSNGIVGPP